ncbi:MAG: molybdopterin cofactor-binding domain-containing protein, partial [Bdellovibrionota bacterium]
MLTIDEALSAQTVVWGTDNVFKKFEINKGDVDSVWGRAHKIVEGTYKTGAQEQLYIENNGMVARASPLGGVTVWGSMQCPYYVHKALISVFGLKPDQVRVVQSETGGGFGGKEDYPSLLASHAALLAWKSGRTVKMIYDRAEDLAATTKRHPSVSKVKSAWDQKGRLLALDFDFTLDGGAYLTLSPVVLSRGTIHAAGPYFCENVRVRSRAVATNTPPNGAFRGFGAPQSIFAMERHLDDAASALNLDPIAIRKRNFIRKGQTTATGQVIREKVDLAGLLDRAVVKSKFVQKRKRYLRENKKGTVKRGIGVASFMHGAGFTGSGEAYLE